MTLKKIAILISTQTVRGSNLIGLPEHRALNCFCFRLKYVCDTFCASAIQLSTMVYSDFSLSQE